METEVVLTCVIDDLLDVAQTLGQVSGGCGADWEYGEEALVQVGLTIICLAVALDEFKAGDMDACREARRAAEGILRETILMLSEEKEVP
jgi:hypothetical protein